MDKEWLSTYGALGIIALGMTIMLYGTANHGNRVLQGIGGVLVVGGILVMAAYVIALEGATEAPDEGGH